MPRNTRPACRGIGGRHAAESGAGIRRNTHHVRSAPVVDALAEAGFRNITLQTVTGMLKPLNESEHTYSRETSGLATSEVRLSLVCEDGEVATVTDLIRRVGRIGSQVSGWVYVSPVEQALPIGGDK